MERKFLVLLSIPRYNTCKIIFLVNILKVSNQVSKTIVGIIVNIHTAITTTWCTGKTRKSLSYVFRGDTNQHSHEMWGAPLLRGLPPWQHSCICWWLWWHHSQRGCKWFELSKEGKGSSKSTCQISRKVIHFDINRDLGLYTTSCSALQHIQVQSIVCIITMIIIGYGTPSFDNQ